MIQINLLPDVKQEFLKARRNRNTVISIAILAGLVSGALVVILLLLLGVQAGREVLADNAIKNEYAELSQVEDLSELVTLQAQLGAIGDQHEQKKMPSRMFTIIQAVNPGGSNAVQFSSVVVVPEENTITLEGVTQNGYPAVEALKKTAINTKIQYKQGEENVTEPLASLVSIGETSLGEDSDGRRVVRFSLVVQGADMLFSNAAKNMRILGPDRRLDVTDSRIGVPESLFAPQAEEEGEDE